MREMLLYVASGILALFSWFWLGVWTGYHRANQWWWNEMIRRRHALYHWVDGKVYWNEDEPQVPRDPAATQAQIIQARMTLTQQRDP